MADASTRLPLKVDLIGHPNLEYIGPLWLCIFLFFYLSFSTTQTTHLCLLGRLQSSLNYLVWKAPDSPANRVAKTTMEKKMDAEEENGMRRQGNRRCEETTQTVLAGISKECEAF